MLHEKNFSLEYAKRLKKLQEKVESKILLVMRAFIEKPRSRLGWKGLLHDPALQGSLSLQEGLLQSRALLAELAAIGIPLATEFLQPFIVPYIADLISLGFIGARTSASQSHREFASALLCPIGFKNSTSGDITVAVHGALSARVPHSFATINTSGTVIEAHSKGNPYSFIVLRGSETGSNYHETALQEALHLLAEENLDPYFFIDCSHGNSGKDYRKQKEVFLESLHLSQKFPIRGLILESHLEPGNQISLTDSCLGWEETEELILKAAETA